MTDGPFVIFGDNADATKAVEKVSYKLTGDPNFSDETLSKTTDGYNLMLKWESAGITYVKKKLGVAAACIYTTAPDTAKDNAICLDIAIDTDDADEKKVGTVTSKFYYINDATKIASYQKANDVTAMVTTNEIKDIKTAGSANATADAAAAYKLTEYSATVYLPYEASTYTKDYRFNGGQTDMKVSGLMSKGDLADATPA